MKGLHVPIFGPSHIGWGIVDPLFLVGRIIPPGTVGTGHFKLYFLLVIVGVPVEIRWNHADHHNGALFPCNGPREIDGIQGGGAGRNYYGIAS